LKEEQEVLSYFARHDREVRFSQMFETLKKVHNDLPEGMTKADALMELKRTISWHGLEGETVLGSICADGVHEPGACINNSKPCCTVSAVISDINERIMHYSVGNPSKANWQVLSFFS